MAMAGMLIFSASLPATRVAVAALDPWFVTAGRALIAGLLAVAALLILRAPLADAARLARSGLDRARRGGGLSAVLARWR